MIELSDHLIFIMGIPMPRNVTFVLQWALECHWHSKCQYRVELTLKTPFGIRRPVNQFDWHHLVHKGDTEVKQFDRCTDFIHVTAEIGLIKDKPEEKVIYTELLKMYSSLIEYKNSYYIIQQYWLRIEIQEIQLAILLFSLSYQQLTPRLW